MKKTIAVALSAMLSTSLWIGPSSAGDFSGGSKGSGEAPRSVPGAEFQFRDARPMDMPKLDPEEASRAAPMTEDAVLKSMTARGMTADGKEVTVEPSESLRDLIRKQLSGGSRGSDDKKPSAPPRADAGEQSDRVVVGQDDRVEITETEENPFRMIGQILAKSSSGSAWTCSGALIGPRTVLTAAHCLYNYDAGGWSVGIQYVPGRRGSNDSDAPYGAFDWETAYVLNGWFDNYEGSYSSVVRWDLGVLILKEPIGDSLGWLGYANYDDLGMLPINIAGYPGDMPRGTMWLATCDVLPENVAAEYFLMDCDTYPGSSGSAVYTVDENGDGVIVGVNVSQGKSSNTAIRLNASYFEFVDNLNQ